MICTVPSSGHHVLKLSGKAVGRPEVMEVIVLCIFTVIGRAGLGADRGDVNLAISSRKACVSSGVGVSSGVVVDEAVDEVLFFVGTT